MPPDTIAGYADVSKTIRGLMLTVVKKSPTPRSRGEKKAAACAVNQTKARRCPKMEEKRVKKKSGGFKPEGRRDSNEDSLSGVFSVSGRADVPATDAIRQLSLFRACILCRLNAAVKHSLPKISAVQSTTFYVRLSDGITHQSGARRLKKMLRVSILELCDN